MSKHLAVTSHCHTRKLQHEHETKQSISADRARKEGRKEGHTRARARAGMVFSVQVKERAQEDEHEDEGHAHMHSTQTDRQAEFALAWSVCCVVLCCVWLLSWHQEKRTSPNNQSVYVFCACTRLVSVKNAIAENRSRYRHKAC